MVYIKISSDVIHDSIYYTLDGSEPTRESNLYKEPFPVYNSCWVKAIATKDEWIDSVVSSLWVDVSAATPVIVRKDGTAVDNCFIEIMNVSDYEGAENIRFYYTLDGTDPDSESQSFPLGARLNVTSNCTVKMISGGPDSSFSGESVEILIDDLRCQLPEVAPLFEEETGRIEVTMASPTSKARLYYTLDGTVPGSESYMYAGRFYIDHNCTLKVVALADDLLPSEVYETRLFITLPVPSLYYDTNESKLIISNLGTYDLTSTRFYYTTDGSEPTEDSNLYNIATGIKPIQGVPIKVVAIDIQGQRSEVTEIVIPIIWYTVTLNTNGGMLPGSNKLKVAEGKTVTLKDPTREYYTFEGWYLDTLFTQLFDPDTPIMSNLTLYAGWGILMPSVVVTIEDETDAPVLAVRYSSDRTRASISFANDYVYSPDATFSITKSNITEIRTRDEFMALLETLTENGGYNVDVGDISATDIGQDPSDIVHLAIEGLKLRTPAASYTNGELFLETDPRASETLFSVDGSQPSTPYTGPIKAAPGTTIVAYSQYTDPERIATSAALEYVIE